MKSCGVVSIEHAAGPGGRVVSETINPNEMKIKHKSLEKSQNSKLLGCLYGKNRRSCVVFVSKVVEKNSCGHWPPKTILTNN